MPVSSAEATVERLLQRVRGPLVQIEKEYRRLGRSVADAGLEEVAGRMAAVVPAPSPVNERFGPFYRTDQVVRLLGISRQAIAERVKHGSLLGMQTADGTWVYPTFQFFGRRVMESLLPLLSNLARATNGWAAAAWLVSPNAALGGARPLERAKGGLDLERLAALAQEAARGWTR